MIWAYLRNAIKTEAIQDVSRLSLQQVTLCERTTTKDKLAVEIKINVINAVDTNYLSQHTAVSLTTRKRKASGSAYRPAT